MTTYSASAYHPHAARNHTPTILIIDDNSMNRRLTKMMLSRGNYICCSAGSIAEGRKVLQDGGIHLVVSDLIFDHSPTATLALLAEMNADPVLARIPVIITTGYPSDAVRRRVLEAGAADIITMPYEEEQLLTCVKQCLSQKQA